MNPDESGTTKPSPKKERKKKTETTKEPQKRSPKSKKQDTTIVYSHSQAGHVAQVQHRTELQVPVRVPTMAERKFNDPSMITQMEAGAALTQLPMSSGQAVQLPMSTTPPYSVTTTHAIKPGAVRVETPQQRSVSPSRTESQGHIVHTQAHLIKQQVESQRQQQEHAQWLAQTARYGSPRQMIHLPKQRAPQQQFIRELGPVGKHGGERIILQRHITPPNLEGGGMLRQQLLQKISNSPDIKAHEHVFKAYKQTTSSQQQSGAFSHSVTTGGQQSGMPSHVPQMTTVHELIERQNRRDVEAVSQKGVAHKDAQPAHYAERFSPSPKQVSTIRRTPSPAHMHVGKVSPGPPQVSSQQRRSPGPSLERARPVNLSVSETREAFSTGAVGVTTNQPGLTHGVSTIHRAPSTDEYALPARDMMTFAQAQGDMLRHTLLTGALPTQQGSSRPFERSIGKESYVGQHHVESETIQLRRQSPSPSHHGRIEQTGQSPHRHPSPQQRQPSPGRSPSHITTTGTTQRLSTPPSSVGVISSVARQRTPSPKPQHRHKEAMAAIGSVRQQSLPGSISIPKSTGQIMQPFVNLVRLNVPVSGSQHSLISGSVPASTQTTTPQRANPILQSQLSQGYEPQISPGQQENQVRIPLSQVQQENPFTFPSQPPTSLSQIEHHAFAKYQQPINHNIPEQRTLPYQKVKAVHKKSESPDEMPRLTPIDSVKSFDQENQDVEMVEMEAPYSKRLQNIANLPTSSVYRSTYRAHSVAIHRAKAGLITSTAKSLDILRQNLQRFINKEIDVIIQQYMEKFFKPGIENIKINNGESSVNDEHVQAVCRQILEEAKKMYCSDQSLTPSRPDLSDNVSESGSTGSRRIRKRRGSDTDSEKNVYPLPKKKKGRPPLYVSGRSTPSKPVKASEPVRREGPKWNYERLTTRTLFVMGAKANKALGLGATRGRIYIKHPETFKYSGDQDDKLWLYENHHMPATGGKTYMLILEDIKDLTQEEDYKDNPNVNVDSLVGFTVPEWMIEKMRNQMKALSTDSYKQKSRSRSTTPSELRDQDDDSVLGKLPFSSFASPKDQDLDKEEKSSSADTETEFFSGNDNDNATLSPYNLTGGFDEGTSPSHSDLDNMEEDENMLSGAFSVDT